MRKIILLLIVSVSVAFAGNFQRASDTVYTDYYPVRHSIPKYEHGLGMNNSPRTSPTYCANVNCPREKYPYQKRKPVRVRKENK